MKSAITSGALFFAVVMLSVNAIGSYLDAKAKEQVAAKHSQYEAKLDAENVANCAAGKGNVLYYKGVYCSK